MNDDRPIGGSRRFLVDPFDEVQHAGSVLGRVEVLPLQVVIVANGPTRLLLLDSPFARFDGERQFSDDVVGVTFFGAEADVDDQVGSGQVVKVTGLRPVLCAFDPIVLFQIGQHDNHFNTLKKISITVNSSLRLFFFAILNENIF